MSRTSTSTTNKNYSVNTDTTQGRAEHTAVLRRTQIQMQLMDHPVWFIISHYHILSFIRWRVVTHVFIYYTFYTQYFAFLFSLECAHLVHTQNVIIHTFFHSFFFTHLNLSQSISTFVLFICISFSSCFVPRSHVKNDLHNSMSNICMIPFVELQTFLKVSIVQSSLSWKILVSFFDGGGGGVRPQTYKPTSNEVRRFQESWDVRLLCDTGEPWENRLFPSNLPVPVPAVDRWIMLPLDINNRKNPSNHFLHQLILCRVGEAWSISLCTLGERKVWHVNSLSQVEHIHTYRQFKVTHHHKSDRQMLGSNLGCAHLKYDYRVMLWVNCKLVPCYNVFMWYIDWAIIMQYT